jgi:CBS domain-containing protein
MLSAQLIESTFPAVTLTDKADMVLGLMEDYDIQHLPVVADDRYVGLIAKDDLSDVDGETLILSLQYQFIKASVKETGHFTQALKIAADHRLSLVPILNLEGELLGCFSMEELVAKAARFLGTEEPGGLIVLEMDKHNYSFGEISRLVETNDAYITQLNTLIEAETGMLIITIKLNKFEISDIVATFQRYDYQIRYYFGDETYENELKENYDHLMAYLKM